MFDPDQYNEEVKGWGKGLPDLLRSRAGAYGIQHRENSPSDRSSLNSMGVRYKQSDGLISLVTLRLNRSLIYTHKGAGKGRGGNKGSRWIDKYGTQKKTAASSIGKAGTAGRREKPFINDVFNSPSGINQLADIVSNNLATAIVKSPIKL